jgi:hypothetical protein
MKNRLRPYVLGFLVGVAFAALVVRLSRPSWRLPLVNCTAGVVADGCDPGDTQGYRLPIRAIPAS